MATTKTTKTVLITGATRGIGLELATQYKNGGWNVIGAARDLNKAGNLHVLAPYKIVQIDIGDEASILQAAEDLAGETIDVLINNAGIVDKDDTFDSFTKESMLRLFEVDTIGPLLITRAFAPHLRAAAAVNGSALVAQLSSYVGSITLNDGTFATGLYGYRAAKVALNMVNVNLALDLMKDNIVTVAIHPGYVATDMNGGVGLIQADESVAGIIKVLTDLKTEDTGKFFNYDGAVLPW